MITTKDLARVLYAVAATWGIIMSLIGVFKTTEELVIYLVVMVAFLAVWRPWR